MFIRKFSKRPYNSSQGFIASMFAHANLHKKYPHINFNQIPKSDIDNLNCLETIRTFSSLIKRGVSLEVALSEIRGLGIPPTKPFNNLNVQILNAIAQGCKRKDVFLLLRDKSLEEVENNEHLKNDFIRKLNFILKTRDQNLFAELKNMESFSELEQQATEELVARKRCTYVSAVRIIQEHDNEALKSFITQKYRDSAQKALHLKLPLGNWFNSYEHVDALVRLRLKYPLQQTIAILKSAKNSDEVKCLALGLSPEDIQKITNSQRECFLNLKLTREQAFAIHSNVDARNTIETFIKSHIHVDDAIKINNLLGKTGHNDLYNLIHLFTPRLKEPEEVVKKRDEYKIQERDLFHPGAIISALMPLNKTVSYNYSASDNPFIVSHLLFHVMGLDLDYFEKISDKKPFFNKEFLMTIELAREKLRRKYPDLAEYADNLENHAIYLSDDDKVKLSLDIERRFGNIIPIQKGLVNEVMEPERRFGFGR